MWKSFSQTTDDPAIYLRVDEIKPKTPKERLRYRISVTNYVKLWARVFDDDSILVIMLESNKDVETENKKSFLQNGLDMLYFPELLNSKELTELDTGDLSVKLTYKDKIVLKMMFTLKVCNADQFFYSVTRPLLMTINDLMLSENKLRRDLIMKDQEISGLLDMLPQNSPLMRCFRTDVYNDREHMKCHNARTTFFGTDPELKVNPQHILYGKPLPTRPCHSERRSRKEAAEVQAESSRMTNELLPQRPVIKVEPMDGDGLVASQELILPLVTNMPVQISAVKNEPNDGVNEPNDDTSESNDDTQKPNVGTSGPNDGTIVNGSDNENKLQTDAANKMSTQSPGENAAIAPDSLNQPMPAVVTEQSVALGPTPMDQDSNATTIPETKPDGQGYQSSMPKKRRNNLNY